jgi:hypothetical protein
LLIPPEKVVTLATLMPKAQPQEVPASPELIVPRLEIPPEKPASESTLMLALGPKGRRC